MKDVSLVVVVYKQFRNEVFHGYMGMNYLQPSMDFYMKFYRLESVFINTENIIYDVIGTGVYRVHTDAEHECNNLKIPLSISYILDSLLETTLENPTLSEYLGLKRGETRSDIESMFMIDIPARLEQVINLYPKYTELDSYLKYKNMSTDRIINYDDDDSD